MTVVSPTPVPKTELDDRLARLRARLDTDAPEWRMAIVQTKVNLYYLTGTRQNGALFVPRDGESVFFVRRSYSRALDESQFARIEPIRSFRDIGDRFGKLGPTVHLEKEVVSLAHFERLNKYFGFTDVQPLDPGLLATRAVKTPYELERMTASGRIHQEVLEDVVPTLLIQGISEAELGVEILSAMLQRGHHGVTRIGMFDTELFLGQICFGDSSTYPNPFDGPGGVRGLSPAVPLFGSRERTLRRGQIVFVDVGCGVDGYHTDKTMVYAFGDVPDEARDAHRQCVDIQNRIAAELRPGTAPSALYERIVADLEPAFLETFMGAGREQVRFLGHGVGLVIDESPVIAKGFDEPLQENMTLALEPKKALPGIGMVGIENTFRVTPAGGTSLTGTSPGLIQV